MIKNQLDPATLSCSSSDLEKKFLPSRFGTMPLVSMETKRSGHIIISYCSDSQHVSKAELNIVMNSVVLLVKQLATRGVTAELICVDSDGNRQPMSLDTLPRN